MITLTTVFSILLWCSTTLGHRFGACSNDSVVLTSLERGYGNKEDLPGNGEPVVVTVELWVQEISKINELLSEFELDIYITESWRDPSLAFDHLAPCKANISLDGGKWRDKFWNPNNCFVNSKRAKIHKSPFTNIFFMIYANGSVWVNYRIKLTAPCEKDLKTFPIDRQKCFLTFESFNHNEDEVQLVWKREKPILLLKEIQLPDYELVNMSAVHVQRNYPPGRWHELTATFSFKRQYGFYILQVYVPSYLVVLISWISLFLGAKAMPPRTILGVNSLLALSFQFGSVITNLPKTSDVKAIDVFVLCCSAFIFCSLVELAVIGYLTRKDTRRTIECRCSWLCMQCPVWTANKIDGLCLIIFPSLFAIFNIWYWCFFLR